jgi:hypothetical protein
VGTVQDGKLTINLPPTMNETDFNRGFPSGVTVEPTTLDVKFDMTTLYLFEGGSRKGRLIYTKYDQTRYDKIMYAYFNKAVSMNGTSTIRVYPSSGDEYSFPETWQINVTEAGWIQVYKAEIYTNTGTTEKTTIKSDLSDAPSGMKWTFFPITN